MNRLKWFALLFGQIFTWSANASGAEAAAHDEQKIPVSSTNNGKISYEPGSCRTKPMGMIYFAAGRVVFKVPKSDLLYIRGMGEEERALLPRRRGASESEGCPDNPLWGSSFKIKFSDIPRRGETAFSELVVTVVARGGDEVKQYDSAYTEFEYLKSKFPNECLSSVGDFVICRYPTKKKNIPDELRLTVYQAKPGHYVTPGGQPFSISCSSLRRMGEAGRECSVGYNLDKNISVFYDVYLDKVPVGEVVRYDMMVRELIATAIVANYQWLE